MSKSKSTKYNNSKLLENSEDLRQHIKSSPHPKTEKRQLERTIACLEMLGSVQSASPEKFAKTLKAINSDETVVSHIKQNNVIVAKRKWWAMAVPAVLAITALFAGIGIFSGLFSGSNQNDDTIFVSADGTPQTTTKAATSNAQSELELLAEDDGFSESVQFQTASLKDLGSSIDEEF